MDKKLIINWENAFEDKYTLELQINNLLKNFYKKYPDVNLGANIKDNKISLGFIVDLKTLSDTDIKLFINQASEIK